MKFMLMMNAPRGKSGDWSVVNWTPEELKAHVGFMVRFNKELRAEGVLVGAEGLASPGEARIVRAGKGGTPEVTDGPFAESKEFLAGYWIVDVESPQQAYAIAGRASAAPGPGGKPLNLPIEVREVMSGPPVEP
ncbi:MAG TPA: YciI family protein [Polyangiaceae bacterium]|nr:YciI family protein [Polyangiaceae bacterium]